MIGTGVRSQYGPRPKMPKIMQRQFGEVLIGAHMRTRRMKMKKFHEFTIIASGLDPNADDFENRFFEAGCGDATISLQKGSIIEEFSREAQTFASALISACADVVRAGAKVDRIEPDHLVSLSDIAK